MGTWLKSFCTAMSTYSVVPMPQLGWDERSLAYSFCFLPVVGVVIGLLEWAWLRLCWYVGFNLIFKSAVCVLIPLLITGGIHMDGFCDTMDALCAHKNRERSLEIMKDSHSGAFAIIFSGAYLVYDFGLMSEIVGSAAVFCTVFVLSRAISVLSVTGKKNARGSGMLAQFSAPLHVRTVRVWAWCWIACCALLMDSCDLYAGTGALIASIVAWHIYHFVAFKRFGGITGDTSGFFVQILEIAMFTGMAVGQAVEIVTYKL